MESKCKACGGCCRYLMTKFTKKELLARLPREEAEFVRVHWRERRFPHRKANRFMPDELHRSMVHFECDQFDAATNKCLGYEDRPGICRRYPTPDDNVITFMSDQCGFMP